VARTGSPFRRKQRLHWSSHNDSGGMEENASNVDVGGNLRRIREQRDLTIRALADQSGLAVNTLSLIENGKSSPSVNTLQQLASALEVPLTAFFEIEIPRTRVAYFKAGRRPHASFEHGMIEDLGSGTTIESVEPFVVSLKPNANSGDQAILHTGFEFVYCLSGQIAYTIQTRTYLLEPGDSLLFEAHLPHRWQNLNQSESRMILVLYPTDERDFPAERHFPAV